MPKKIISKNFIVKSNKLVEANYRLTSGEQKLIYKLIISINKDDADFKEYKFKVSEFMSLLGVNNSKKYDEVKKITYDLLGKKISIYDEVKKKLTQVTWLAQAEYYDGTGTVNLCFAPALKPYLLQLKDSFTLFDINNILQLRSGYSHRIYELLKQYERLHAREFYLYDIRDKLGISEKEYIKYNDFKRKVILQAQKEINSKTDITFEFEEIKEGRKVNKLKFIITSKKQKNISTLLEEKNQNTHKDSEIENIITQFKKKYNANLSFKLVQDLISEKSINHVKDCLKKYDEYVCGDIKNIAGHFYKFVKEGYEKPVNHKANYLFPQLTNFRQREYTEEDFEDFFDKVGEE